MEYVVGEVYNVMTRLHSDLIGRVDALRFPYGYGVS